MPSLEDGVYEWILQRLRESDARVLSAHPPSGKAYDTDLIRIPSRRQNAGRYHVDVIFTCRDLLFLLELKGRSSECDGDVKKLRAILSDHDLSSLLAILRRRISVDNVNWDDIQAVVPAVGVAILTVPLPKDIVAIVTPVCTTQGRVLCDPDHRLCVVIENAIGPVFRKAR